MTAGFFTLRENHLIGKIIMRNVRRSNEKKIHRTAASLAIATVMALAISVGASIPARAQSGLCPSFSASDIDVEFLKWLDDTGVDLGLAAVEIDCIDSPSVPDVEFAVDPNRNMNFFGARVSPEEAIGVSLVDDVQTLWGPRLADLTVSEAHICRAEILRSVAWRQNCRGNQN
jgi:hypothetical protein